MKTKRAPLEKHASYLQLVFQRPKLILDRCQEALKDVDYDTIAVTGNSGALILLQLAKKLKKNAALVRKAKDNSHSCTQVEGTIGKRFVIVDDQISTGNTMRRLIRTLYRHCDQHRYPMPEFVGVCCYLHVECGGPSFRLGRDFQPIDEIIKLPDYYF